MISSDFQTTTHAKWILSGEHAVIRGHGALVFPIREKKLTLSYTSSSPELCADYEGECGSDMHLLFWSVLEQGMQLLGKSLNSLNGKFYLQSNIPIGVGMGASAALCVAVARWFEAQGLLNDWQMVHFAKALENLFHGQSSGLDIAGVSAETGMYFRQGEILPLKQHWQPIWRLSSCGQIGITAHCINQVQTLRENNPELADKLDHQMAASVALCCSALEQESDLAVNMLKTALNSAADCFQQWGLVSESLQHHMKMLYDAGAIAVKPTGSGGGGYVISLWEAIPNSTLTSFISP